VQTSCGSFVARELIEPFSREEANEATGCAMRSLSLWVLAINVHRKGGWATNDRGNRQLRLAFEGLKPCEVKVSYTVLRGLGVSNDPRLPDQKFLQLLILHDFPPLFGDNGVDAKHLPLIRLRITS
jgi:hypothetical protein